MCRCIKSICYRKYVFKGKKINIEKHYYSLLNFEKESDIKKVVYKKVVPYIKKNESSKIC